MNLQKLIDDAIEVARASVPAHPPLLAPGEHLRWIYEQNGKHRIIVTGQDPWPSS